jgi:hypothetical protein
MANIGRGFNQIGYSRSGSVNLNATSELVFEEPAVVPQVVEEKAYFLNTTPSIYEVETTTNTAGDTVLTFKYTNGQNITTTIPALPISVNEVGKIVLGGSVIVEGDIETSTESGQIIGDTKDTIIEDIDGGTF